MYLSAALVYAQETDFLCDFSMIEDKSCKINYFFEKGFIAQTGMKIKYC